MKILAIHNYHRKGSASGDDQVFNNETKLLQKYGHEVIKYTISNDSFDNAGLIRKLFITLGMLWSFKHYKNIRDIIKKENPDVTHIHTFFPLLSPSILYAAKREGCKVVATLHDTRFICPCATSLYGNTLCNKCSDGKYFRMFKLSCFKNSRWQSLFVALVFSFHRVKKSFYNQIDNYICLNENQIFLLEQAGYSKDKISKKYNFVNDIVLPHNHTLPDLPDRYIVFYGRIGEEKGIYVLEKIWDTLQIPLVVMGSGPLEDEFEAWVKQHSQVLFLGYTEHSMCLEIVKRSEFVVFPSIWYEGCSMVEIEAESLGKPLIATDLGFSSEAIQNGVNGYKVPIGNIELFRKTIQYLWNSPEEIAEMSKNSRLDYQKKYTPEDNYKQLLKIYEQ